MEIVNDEDLKKIDGGYGKGKQRRCLECKTCKQRFVTLNSAYKHKNSTGHRRYNQYWSDNTVEDVELGPNGPAVG